MPSILVSAAPYHIITYGVLLGTEVFQSFGAGIIQFKTLPRAQFSTLQQATFPIYFSLQTALPLLLALTLPTERTAIGTTPSSLPGVLHPSNRTPVLLPLTLNLLCAATNLLYLGPQTTSVMRERKHQETRDGKKSYDAGPHSAEMERLNRKFSWLHGASTVVNLVGIAATVWYGFYLGQRMM
ncbi:uncharacterized protein HMPREF1541_08670 [Cyphellophora europaea CBS 101466]|uniref:TMEM205-like domain-containing protein n=1 Tax=Cyphellophora europaea (strain CBS 101466) TaxID=1220924 RepID=W2RL28_CYPE1|nr:uncharacterized protein HMPREF1541_08670 [Cyphellophora europaea CBS 101466]ETN36393.1 hypothetical protein HMPREF1541_08670 [Cyphellophora europaea CBS 101466]